MRKEYHIEILSVNDTIRLARAQTKAYAIAPFIIIIGIIFHFFPILPKGSLLRDAAFMLSLILVVIQILFMNWKFFLDRRKNIKWVYNSRVDKIWTEEAYSGSLKKKIHSI